MVCHVKLAVNFVYFLKVLTLQNLGPKGPPKSHKITSCFFHLFLAVILSTLNWFNEFFSSYQMRFLTEDFIGISIHSHYWLLLTVPPRVTVMYQLLSRAWILDAPYTYKVNLYALLVDQNSLKLKSTIFTNGLNEDLKLLRKWK